MGEPVAHPPPLTWGSAPQGKWGKGVWTGGWTEQREGKDRRVDRGKAGRQGDGGEEAGMDRKMDWRKRGMKDRQTKGNEEQREVGKRWMERRK